MPHGLIWSADVAICSECRMWLEVPKHFQIQEAEEQARSDQVEIGIASRYASQKDRKQLRSFTVSPWWSPDLSGRGPTQSSPTIPIRPTVPILRTSAAGGPRGAPDVRCTGSTGKPPRPPHRAMSGEPRDEWLRGGRLAPNHPRPPVVPNLRRWTGVGLEGPKTF